MRQLYFICLLGFLTNVGFAQTTDLTERVKALEDH
jgi:hypothetical protein